MPKRKKRSKTKSPTKSTSNESKVSSPDRRSPQGDGDACLTCGERGCHLCCDKNLPPVVGLNRNVSVVPSSAPSANWHDSNRYSLPPFDRSQYDLRGDFEHKTERSPESGASQTSSRSHKSKKDQKLTSRWTEEFLVKSPRTGCWCRDCPWLIAYGILMFIWILLVGVCFFQKHLSYLSPPIVDDFISRSDDSRAANCLSACSRLTPPAHLTAAEKAVFHCTLHKSRWEGTNDIGYDNPNCAEDCKSYGNVGEFVNACAIGYVPNGDEDVDRIIDGFPNSNVFFDRDILDWHWIAHVMVITNTVSLFLLLVPLFFCCMQVVIFSVTSMIINIALTTLLWCYVYFIITKLKETNRFSLKDPFFINQTLFAGLSTILTVYVIVVAIIVITKRLKVTCEVARFTSKFVNSVPSVLFEALLTLILLLLWAIAILCASIIIERGGFNLSGDIQLALPTWVIWIARILTTIMAFWTAQFIINCQTIIVHGAMARFYFDKELMNRVMKSHVRLLKYHLCTACFAGILFNWLYWLRWVHPKSIIRSRSLFGTATYGATFFRAGKEVNHLLHPPEGSRLKSIAKVNPFYFLIHIQAFAIMAIVTHLVFFTWKSTLYIELILVFYAYFVGLATVNIYRVTKDSIFLCYELDRSLTSMNPARLLKMPNEDPYLYARLDRSRIHPR